MNCNKFDSFQGALLCALHLSGNVLNQNEFKDIWYSNCKIEKEYHCRQKKMSNLKEIINNNFDIIIVAETKADKSIYIGKFHPPLRLDVSDK